MKTISTLLLLALLLPLSMVAQSADATNVSLSKILAISNFAPSSHREVVILLPELGCISSIDSVIRYANRQDTNVVNVLIVADSKKAIKCSSRYKGLKLENPLFVSTEVAEENGLSPSGPVFAFYEGNKVVSQIRIGCDTFRAAQLRVLAFLEQPYTNRYREMAGL